MNLVQKMFTYDLYSHKSSKHKRNKRSRRWEAPRKLYCDKFSTNQVDSYLFKYTRFMSLR